MSGGNKIIGANGSGRIGKHTVWHDVARKYFFEMLDKIGRPVVETVHYLIVKREKYKTSEFKIQIGPAGLKMEIKRQPTVKTIVKCNKYENPNGVKNETPSTISERRV